MQSGKGNGNGTEQQVENTTAKQTLKPGQDIKPGQEENSGQDSYMYHTIKNEGKFIYRLLTNFTPKTIHPSIIHPNTQASMHERYM